MSDAKTTQQLEAVFDHILEGVVVRDPKGFPIHFNRAALTLLELTADQLRGVTQRDPMWRLVDESGQPLKPDSAPSSLAQSTGQIQKKFVMGYYNGRGDLRWLSVTAVPLFNEGETTPYQVVTTFSDITEERAALTEVKSVREEMKNRAALFEATLKNLPCLVSYITNEFIYKYVNATFELVHEVQSKDVIGKSVREIVGHEMYPYVEPKLKMALEGKSFSVERHHSDRSGIFEYVVASYTPDFGENGEVTGVYIVVHDVTTQKKAQLSIERGERQISRMLDMLPVPISYWTTDSVNIYSNDLYAQYFQLEPSEIPGMHLSALIGKPIFDELESARESVFEGKTVNFEYDMKLINGSSETVLVTYLPDWHDDKAVGYYIMVADVTNIRALETERRDYESKLVAASKMSSLGEMAGGIAHEINNPLAIISGRASLMRQLLEEDDVDKARLGKELNRIELTVERIAKIIRGLRAFARNSDDDEMTAVSLTTVLNDTLELCQERIKNQQVELKFTPPQELFVSCRPSQISQVLMNLIGNALDAISDLPVKWIEVKTEVEGSTVRVFVIDSGAGIPEAVVEKMMNPFYTTKEVGKGTGLGLSISKGLAAKNNGSLDYVRGKNTIFVLTLSLGQVLTSADTLKQTA